MARTPVRPIAILSLIIGMLLLAACPLHEEIAKIKADPGRYAGKEISIAGRVVNSVGALGHGVFEIDDGTGTMWVFSERYGIPGNDAKVSVTGTVEEGFSFGGRNFAVILRETEARN